MSKLRKNQFARPRFQRKFIAWFIKNRVSFLMKAYIYRLTHKEIILAFVGMDPMVIYAAIQPEGIMVIVEQSGRFYDALFDLDVTLERIPEGYVCERCDSEFQVIYPTREDLWQDHLFEPFLAWVNEKLAFAKGIRIASDNGCTWAKLLAAIDEPLDGDPNVWLLQNLKPLNQSKQACQNESSIQVKTLAFRQQVDSCGRSLA